LDNVRKGVRSEVGALTLDLERNLISLGLCVGAPSFGKREKQVFHRGGALI
jgi:hypothetical protein